MYQIPSLPLRQEVETKAVLRVLRILNEDNDVTVFSLIGRKDLMAEAM